MKFSESWLREWVNPKLTREQLCDQLTMAGLEIEELSPLAEAFTGVVIGQVLQIEKHPEADRLNICQVDVGKGAPLTIVCGASNVKPNMKVAAALDKAELPKQIKIGVTKVRGITSNGMLCSAKELSLAEESEGLFELPADAPIGKDVWEYLKLADYLIDVSITPNRGDCLSILGMAKEVSALTEASLTMPKIENTKASINDTLLISNQAPKDCPHYVGRIIRNVKLDAPTPIWMREHLRRSGIRSINSVVDVMNYVMIELGQPMHAFSLDKISQEIVIRHAKKGETLELLDGTTATLDAETLLIADNKKPLAIAGVMGGLDSGVSLLTKDIFLESAYFTPQTIAGTSRRYKMGSDSSYRFERGVDPALQILAIERATALLLEMVGGQAGPVIDMVDEKTLPKPATIHLRRARLQSMLGYNIPDATVENILKRLGFNCRQEGDWIVDVPTRRSDITIEVDLIEEIARLYGYNNIPSATPKAQLQINTIDESKVTTKQFRLSLIDQGYNEVVTYSFVDDKLQAKFTPDLTNKELLNPITADMNVMRTTLLPGLINTLLYNQNRQQSRVRIFETGLRFIVQGDKLLQQKMLSGLISGTTNEEQWGIPTRAADFFDMKGNLENLFQLTFAANDFAFKKATHPALHPGQTAEIYRGKNCIGIMGALHPSLIQDLKIEGKVFVFELQLDGLEPGQIPTGKPISKFPEIRRDLSLLVEQSIPAQKIEDAIKETSGELLTSINIFDIYQGKGIAPGHKSIAIALTLQHYSRTLVDVEVAELMDRVILTLKGKFNAELRG